MTGRLIGVVGPSGVGKDSVMQGLAEAHDSFALVRRVITRAPELGGEDYYAVSDAAFLEMKASGAFCIDWPAHGLLYGIPREVLSRAEAGEQLLVNLSRSVVSEVAAQFAPFTVLNITARPETLAARLASRGREASDEIARRLNRAVVAFPEGVSVVTVSNDGPLEETVRAALARLQPVRA